MKILFISHKYPPSIGGMEKHAYKLRNRLAQQHEIVPLIYDNKEGRFAFFRKLEKRAIRLFRRHSDIDLIYVNEGLLACFVARFKRWTTVPIVATVHGLDVVFPNSVYQYFVKKQLTKLDGLIAVSRATAAACIDRGIPKEKVIVINNGIDHDLKEVETDSQFLAQLERTHQLSLKGKNILVTMGRPVKRKGFSWFVEKVMPQLPKDTVLLLIGPRKGTKNGLFSLLPTFIKKQLELAFSMSSDEMDLAKAAQISENQSRVIEVGKLPFAEVQQLLRVAHLFIMPNRRVKGDMEGFGLVALESAILGTPVAASGIEGIRDAVQDGKNGYLLPPENASAWSEKVAAILDNKKELVDFSQSAKRYTLRQFSWEKMTDAYHTFFEALVQKDTHTDQVFLKKAPM
ncbi:MAG: glycosyltransferase family 4 protein [Bacteroidota bacterium]